MQMQVLIKKKTKKKQNKNGSHELVPFWFMGITKEKPKYRMRNSEKSENFR
jgi:hypothetical protein